MKKFNETSTDRVVDEGDGFSDFGSIKKPNWVDMAPLDGVADESLLNRLVYKPALRFHNLSGSLWSPALGRSPSIVSDSRPPSYRFSESMRHKYDPDTSSMSDQGSAYNARKRALSPLTLRRRNTVAVIFVAIALLAAVAVVTGVILHFINPRAMVRANVRFTIANRNFTDEMRNMTSDDYKNIAEPLCAEMDTYFLTSEVADFYFGCTFEEVSEDRSKPGSAVYLTLDFVENMLTNDGNRIKKIIMKKSGRHSTEDTLFLVIKDFLVYLRSLRVDLDIIPMSGDHPKRFRPRIPWNDLDFIFRKSSSAGHVPILTSRVSSTLTPSISNVVASKTVLPERLDKMLHILTPEIYSPSVVMSSKALRVSSAVQEHIQSHKRNGLHFNKFGPNVLLSPTKTFESVQQSEESHAWRSSLRQFPEVQEFFNTHGIVRTPVRDNEIEKNGMLKIRKANSNTILTAELMPVGQQGAIDKQKFLTIDSLETSFQPPSDVSPRNQKATQAIPPTKLAELKSDVPKVFSLHSDVFLIVGKEDNSFRKKLLEPAETDDAQNAFTSTVISDKIMSSSVDWLDATPDHFLSSSSLPSVTQLNTFKSSVHLHKLADMIATASDPARKGEGRLNDIKNPYDVIELNELIVKAPKQESIAEIEEIIHWNNIFNIPRPKETRKVGDLNAKESSPNIGHHNDITTLQNEIPNAGGHKNSAITGTRKRKHYYDTIHIPAYNKASMLGYIQSFTDLTKINSTYPPGLSVPVDSSRKHSHVHNVTTHDHILNLIDRIENHNPALISPENNHYDKLIDDAHIVKTLNMSVNSNEFNALTKSQHIQRLQRGHNKFPFDRGSHKLKNEQGSSFIQKMLPKTQVDKGSGVLFLRNGHYNGRHALFLGKKAFHPDQKANGNQQHAINASTKDGSSFDKKTQPRIFLHNLNVNFGNITNITVKREPMAIPSRNGRPGQSGKSVHPHRRLSHFGSQSGFLDRYHAGFQMLPRMHLFNKYQSRPIAWRAHGRTRGRTGLTKSRNFTDIDEMKDVMNQLVSSLANMTMKIDKMQTAIHFVNKTLHETQQPLFRLEETLQNMTVSLKNLNDNLRDVNQTMLSIKYFLKQFDSNVFNLRDVLSHLDRTVVHLGDSVTFVGSSMVDLNATVTNAIGNMVNMNDTLSHINRSVTDVNQTATFTNKTLESMGDTLISLEEAIGNLNKKVGFVANEFETFNFSLHGINKTVHNSYGKLSNLRKRLTNVNSTADSIDSTVERLKDTYTKLGKTLENMNETFAFVNGTVLEVIQKLSDVDINLVNVISTMNGMKDNMTEMNASISDTMLWMTGMLDTLHIFNLSYQFHNETIRIALNNVDLIETVGLLLDLNGTLVGLGKNVDKINMKLDSMDDKMTSLEETLVHFEDTLSKIGVTFEMLNKTLDLMNKSMVDTRSSVRDMDSTISHIENSFKEIKPSFEFINMSLELVNKTIITVKDDKDYINTTIKHVNNTLQRMNETAVSLDTFGINLNTTINAIRGSIPEMNVQIYNANESLRMLKGKTDIFVESYNMLDRTMFNMETAFEDIVNRISEAEATLKKTNDSFASVNSSITNLEDSYSKIDDQLNRLEESFTNMNDSMYGIGSAFPSISGSVKDTKDKIISLRKRLTTSKRKLIQNYTRRNVSLDRYHTLTDDISDIKKETDKLRQDMDAIQTLSKSVSDDVLTLQRNVRDIEFHFGKVDTNFKAINSSLPAMKDTFRTLQRTTGDVGDDLLSARKETVRIAEDLQVEIDDLKRYENVDVPLALLQSEVGNQLDILNVSQNHLLNENKSFELSKYIIWNENFNPILLHNTTEELNGSVLAVMKIMEDYSVLLSNSTLAINGSRGFIDYMHGIFEKIEETKQSIDEIETKRDGIGRRVDVVQMQLKNKSDDVRSLAETLRERLEQLTKLKAYFGNVNGTYKGVGQYEDLEQLIRQTNDSLLNLQKQVADTKSGFTDTVDNFQDIDNTYTESRIDLTDKSSDILNTTSNVFKETDLNLKHINTTMNLMDDAVSTLEDLMENITSMVGVLENDLIYAKNKQSVISERRPVLEKGFELMVRPIEGTKKNIKDLHGKIDQLLVEAITINNKSDKIGNMQVSTKQEIDMLEGAKIKIDSLQDLVDTLSHNMTAKQTELLSFNESTSQLTEIKQAYDDFQTSLNGMVTSHEHINKEETKVEDIIQQIASIFQGLNMIMENVKRANATLLHTGNDLGLLETYVVNTEARMENASSHLSRVKLHIDLISKNYTNFTATDIDLSELYVHEAIDEMEELFGNLTELLESENEKTKQSRLTYNETYASLSLKELNRQNIDETLNTVVHPNLNDIIKQIETTEQTLEKLNKRIAFMDATVDKVNETLYLTNTQLFIDRQKELLADAKVPNLDVEVDTLNGTLQDTEIMVKDAQRLLSEVKETYTLLQKRLESTPTSNLTIEDFGKQLNDYEGRMQELQSYILEGEDILRAVNETIRTNNGSRYSPDESLNEVRNRYKQAEVKLAALKKNVTDITDEIIRTKEDMLNVHDELKQLNRHLDDVVDINDKIFAFSQEINKIENEMELTDRDITDVESYVRQLGEQYENILNDFSNINESLFNSTMDAFYKKFIETKLDTSLINNNMVKAKKTFNESKAALSDAKDAVNTVFDTDEILKDSIENATLFYEDSIKHYNDVKELLADIQINRTVLKVDADRHGEALREITEVFKRQEKEEYANSNDISGLYKSAEAKFNTSRALIKEMKTERARVLSKLNQLNRTIDDTDDIEFSVHGISNEFTATDGDLDTIEMDFTRVMEDYKNIEKLLNAPDGQVVSDDETISEMKERYRAVFQNLEYVNRSLADLNNVKSVELNESFRSIKDTSETLQSLVDQHRDDSNTLQNLEQEANSLSESIHDISKLNRSVVLSHRLNKYSYGNLTEQYAGTSNDTIRDLKEDIEAAIEMHGENISDAQNAFIQLTEMHKNASDLISIYRKQKRTTINDVNILQNILVSFNKVRDTVPSLLNDSKRKVMPTETKFRDLNESLKNGETELDKLEQLLISKQKEDYFQSKFPENRFKAILSKLQDVLSLNSNVTDNNNHAGFETGELNEKLREHENIELDLQMKTDFIASTTTQVGYNNQTLEDLAERLTEVERFLYSEDGQLISENETIESMKQRYRTVNMFLFQANETLNDMEQNLSNSILQLEDIRKDVMAVDESIDQYRNITLTLDILKALKDNPIEDMKKLNESLQSKTNIIQNAKDSLYKMFERYENVRSDSTNASIKDVLELMKDIGIRIMTEETNLKSITGIFNVVSDSLDGYEQKVRSNFTEKGEIDEVVKLNNTISDTAINALATVSGRLANGFHSDLWIDDSSSNLLQKIQDLEKEFKFEEKRAYLINNIPEIASKINQIHETLGANIEHAMLIQEFKSNVTSLGNKINELLRPEESINLNIDKEMHDVFGIGDQMDNLKELNEQLEQELSSLDKDIVTNQDKYLHPNYTVDDIKSILLSLNATVDRIDSESQSITKDLQHGNMTLHNHKLYFGDIDSHYSDFRYTQKEALEKVMKIKKVVDANKTLSEDLSDVGSELDHLIASMERMSRKFRNVNSSALKSEMTQLADELNNTFGQYDQSLGHLQNLLPDVSYLEESGISIQGLLSDVSADLDSIADRTRTVAIMNKETDTPIYTSTEKVESIRSENAVIKDKISKIRTAMKTLEQKLVKQQIRDYIANNFPSILDMYRNVNDTLADVGTRMNLTSENIRNVYFNLTETRSLLDNVSTIFITVDKLQMEYETQAKQLQDVSKVHTVSMAMFNELETLLAADIESNATLEDIKARFTIFNDSLVDLSDVIETAAISVAHIDKSANTTLRGIEAITEAINEFNEVNETVTDVAHKIQRIGESIKKINDRVSSSGVNVSDITSLAGQLERRFGNVNSSWLNNKTQLMIENVKNLNQKYDAIKQLYDDTEGSFNISNVSVEKAVETVSTDVFHLADLVNITRDVREVSSVLKINETKLQTSVMDISTMVDAFEKDLEEIFLKHDHLRDSYLEKEIDDFLNDSVPLLNKRQMDITSLYSEIIETLKEVREEQKRGNDTFNDIQQDITRLPQIQFSLDTLWNNMTLTDLKLTKLNESVLNDMNIFEGHKQNYLSQNEDWKRLSIAKLKNMTEAIKNVLLSHDDKLDVYNTSIDTIAKDVLADKRKMDKVLALINKYSSLKLNVSSIGTKMNQLNSSVIGSLKVIKDAIAEHTRQNNKLKELNEEYSDVSSDDIKKLRIKLDGTITRELNTALPLLFQNFNETVFGEFETITETYNSVSDILSKYFDSEVALESELQIVENMLDIVNDKLPTVHADNIQLSNTGVEQKNALQDTNADLERLEFLLREQKKRNLIENSLPKFLEKFNDLTGQFADAFKTEENTKSDLSSVQETLENIKGRLDGIANISIPLSEQESTALNAIRTMDVLSNELRNQYKEHLELGILDVEQDRLIANNSVTVQDVITLMNAFNKSISETGLNMNTLRQQNDIVTNNIVGMNAKIGHLNDTLNSYENLVESVNDLDSEITQTERNSSKLHLKIIQLHDAARTLDETVYTLKNKYKSFNYDSSESERKLEKVRNGLDSLLGQYKESSSQLDKSRTEYDDMKNDISRTHSDEEDLLNTIGNVSLDHNTTLMNVKRVNSTLTSIWNTLPDLDISIVDIEREVDIMNNTLINEYNKAQISNNTIPALEKRYEEMRFAFEMTNKSLDSMAGNIRQLKDYIGKLKLRMGEDFSSINISMAENEDEIVRLEDRLLNLQSHYNNSIAVLDNLDSQIEAHRIQGNNVTLQDVKDQYGEFNKTINTVEVVLDKIQQESYEMDEQFFRINSSLLDIDNALDIFEERENTTRNIGNDISGFKARIEESDSVVATIDTTLVMLNNTFNNMMDFYEDVIDTTVEDNSLAAERIRELKEQIKAMHGSVDSLHGQQKQTKSDFDQMNTTLFKQIDTYADLNKTLDTVLRSYHGIEDNIRTLRKVLSDVDTRKEKANSSIDDLTTFLTDLNATLFKEKEKFDFMNSNFKGLESKFNAIDGPLTEAESELSNAVLAVKDVNQRIGDVKDRLHALPNITINVQDDINSVSEMNGQLENMTKEYTKLKNQMLDVGNNISNLGTSPAHINELRERYIILDDTIDELLNNISSVRDNISQVVSATKRIDKKSQQIAVSLDSFGQLTERSANISSEMAVLKENVDDSNAMLNDVVGAAGILEKDINKMNDMYADIKNDRLKQNLTTILNDLLEQKQKMLLLQEHQQNVSIGFNGSELLFKHTKSDLHGSISNINTLETVIGNSTIMLDDTDKKLNELSLSNSKLFAETELVLGNINKLESELRSVNESLFEEKMKNEFIRDNYPEMETRYLLLNEDVSNSNEELKHANDNAMAVSEELAKLKTSLDSMKAIRISLDNESSAAFDIKEDISALVDKYNTISSVFLSLNVSDLKHVEDTSLDQLKSGYTNFNMILNDIKGNITAINHGLKRVNDTSDAVNSSLFDIDKTLAAYDEVRRSLHNQMNTSLHSDSATAVLNSSVLQMKNDLDNLIVKFASLANFSHITDPTILEGRTTLDMMMAHTLKKVNALQGSVGILEERGIQTEAEINNIQETLNSTKDYLQQLKEDVASANTTSRNVTEQYENIAIGQLDADKEIQKLKPELDELLERINNLSGVYQKEQKKIDFIAENKPGLLQKFKKLDMPLSKANDHISQAERGLADVLFNIKGADSRLAKFLTLNFTALKEQETWDNMSQTVKNMSTEFIDVSKLYGQVKDQINLLDDRDMTHEALEEKYRSIEDSLQNISERISNIENTLQKIDSNIEETDNSVTGLNNMMDAFKDLQADSKLTKQTIHEDESTIASLEHTANETSDLIVSLTSIADEMNATYKPINDVNWDKLLPDIRNNISDNAVIMTSTDQALNEVKRAVQNLNTSFEATVTDIKDKIMNRNNASAQIAHWQKEVEGARNTLKQSENDIKKLQLDMPDIVKKTTKLDSLLKSTNETLFVELQKQLLLNHTLPDLKEKHKNVNDTFIQNNPDMATLTSQIAHVYGIVDKIRRKMDHFGLEDSDNSILAWSQSIKKLNDTVVKIIQDNQNSNETLHVLRDTLWSDQPMYTKQETYLAVKERLTGYNNTLDEIKANSHQIKLKLNELGNSIQNVAQEVTERDLMLTTTPATTTPSGPPDWLTFSSSGGGVIGRHSAHAQCSVSNKDDWSTMTITHINKDGVESIVAGWKLGRGARGRRRNRRIKVSKQEDGTGGALNVNISSLQCADEGTYYCSIDTYSMWPLNTVISVSSPPEDNLHAEFPTEVFAEKISNFSCTGNTGYPNGKIIWKIKEEKDKDFKLFDFYSAKPTVWDSDCIRTETNTVNYQFNMTWNNTKIRCYIEDTNYFAQGVIQLLPFDICNKQGMNQAMSHPYTPHKYIICGQELNIMDCPGKTCFDEKEGFCVQCKAGAVGGDPCIGKPMYTAVAHEHDCKKYYMCMGNTKNTNKCPRGYFSPNTPGNCVLSYAQSLCAQKEV